MNKCAENSKQEAQKNQYLVNIKDDLEADKARLQEIVGELETKLKASKKVLPILNTDSENKMSIIQDIFSVATISNFSPKDITYQTLINSGDFKLIDDFELKKAIEAHYSNYKIMMKDYDRQEIIHKEYLGNYFIHNVDYDDFRKGKFGFKDEKLLKNIIQSMNGSFSIKLKATQNGIESCDKLLAILPK
tara:strand:+ start:6602 stop:7171 length:570 start_codon:yes stop_codon:yes gene_type:complete